MIIQQAEEKGIEKGMEKGIQMGIEKGIEKGTLQNKIQIAQKMILKELPDSFICEILDVTPEFVDQVKSEL